MKARQRSAGRGFVLVLAAALVFAACGTGNSRTSGSTAAASATNSAGTSRLENIKFKWGSFSLAKSIATKIKDHRPLTIDMSFQALSTPGAADLLRAGLKEGASWIKTHYGVTVHVNLIGTPDTDPPTQISQIQSLVAAGQVDCVGVEPVTPGAFVNVINSTMAAGVPVMTVNADSPASHRIAYYGVDDTNPNSPLYDGAMAGHFTVQWAKKNHVDLHSAALITGDTTAPWAQGRMKGWEEVVKKAFPGISIQGTPTNAFTTGYTPATIQTKMSAYMSGHPKVQFYFSSDWEAAEIAQLIGSEHLKGKVYTLGFNFDSTILQDLKSGTMIGTLDQRYDLQAKAFVEGCGKMLLSGTVPSQQYQYISPTIWTPSNVAKAQALYNSIPGALG